ncbi:BnaAnng13790D [Brassica napus]|uniref:BnaAnng13790D protein n=1 Tax=Brassica napus TaxID=3708 RepID=A0A078IV56_BRANA|nr:BnaAnng13790D [Brassica napus]
MQLLWLLMRVNGGGGQELPECLKELAGKDFVFKIHIFNTTEGKGASACASNMAAAGGKECGHKRSR